MLDINKTKREMYKHFLISIFFLIFGFIYEIFSHEVYSRYMIYAFLIPLLFGFTLYLVIYKMEFNKYLSELGMSLYNISLITFTLGSVMKGVLEIYGTTNKLVSLYSRIGIFLVIISILSNIIYNYKKFQEKNSHMNN